MPGVPSSFLFLVVRPGAPSSVLATTSNGLQPNGFARDSCLVMPLCDSEDCRMSLSMFWDLALSISSTVPRLAELFRGNCSSQREAPGFGHRYVGGHCF